MPVCWTSSSTVRAIPRKFSGLRPNDLQYFLALEISFQSLTRALLTSFRSHRTSTAQFHSVLVNGLLRRLMLFTTLNVVGEIFVYGKLSCDFVDLLVVPAGRPGCTGNKLAPVRPGPFGQSDPAGVVLLDVFA